MPEPSCAVTVTVCAVPMCAVAGNPPTLNVTSGTDTETVCGFDVLPWKFASPAYAAVNVCDPTVSGGVVQVATPVEESHETPLQITETPSLYVNVPVPVAVSVIDAGELYPTATVCGFATGAVTPELAVSVTVPKLNTPE